MPKKPYQPETKKTTMKHDLHWHGKTLIGDVELKCPVCHHLYKRDKILFPIPRVSVYTQLTPRNIVAFRGPDGTGQTILNITFVDECPSCGSDGQHATTIPELPPKKPKT
ncbi:MAG TPA: hypothetical protein VG326_21465 [Tepidisphaeraceae bacterium]|jgi:hypothetical protein|nr:hypothetical protein [Tepidisphaeraceae bacterium]